MRDKKIVFLLFIALFFSLCLLTKQSMASMKVLTVPGHPLLLFFEHTEGIVQNAYLRSPNGVRLLEHIEGLRLLSDSYAYLKADGDFLDDLVWRLDFLNPRSEELTSLWITSVTETATAWVALAPAGSTFWDEFPMPPNSRSNIFLYISPHLPGYNGEQRRSGSELLSFVYTLILTRNGPKLVAAPEIYRRLLPIAALAMRGEEDESLRNSYTSLYKDFERMSEGRMPSREAMNNFLWQRILVIRWKR